MSIKTISEELFEAFCVNNGIRYERIPTGQQRTPDYDIFLNEQKIVAEIKQINPNPDEQKQLKTFETDGFVIGGGGPPGQRIRKIIDSAARQISNRAKGAFPSLLVVYNNAHIFPHTAPYLILVAMYGLETHDLLIPRNITQRPIIQEKRFGPKRKMTKTDNTSISAVAIITKKHEVDIVLTVYHNVHADIPLEPELLQPFPIKQFSLAPKEQGQFYKWHPL